MNKNPLKLKILNLFFFSLMWNFSPVISRGESFFAPPPIPYKPWGTVTNQGADAPVGITLSAQCGGVQYAQTITNSYDGHTYYSLEVPGDITGTPVIEGCLNGESIIFIIQGVQADQSPVWTEGLNPQLNLTYSATKYSFLPLIIKHGGLSLQGNIANPGASPIGIE